MECYDCDTVDAVTWRETERRYLCPDCAQTRVVIREQGYKLPWGA